MISELSGVHRIVRFVRFVRSVGPSCVRALPAVLPGMGLLLGIGLGRAAVAQSITLDGTLGPVRSLGTGPTYVIRQADGTAIRGNLFHSFGIFNLATGEQASFQSAPAIRNILARVTGGSASSIDGLIFTNSAAVNLFLINPAGIVFGPNARLDIGGTTRGDFTATTLDAIVWPDGSRFDAVNPTGSQPLLRIVGDPSGFVASQRSIPGITVNQSRLEVFNTQDLRLLGGAVNLTRGTLVARGGRVEIGSVTGEGRVVLLEDGQFGVPEGVIRGNIRLNSATVDVRSDNRGDIQVTGRNIGVLAGSTLFAGILGNSGTPTSKAGTLRLNASESVQVEGDSSRLLNNVGLNARGQGGDIVIEAPSVWVGNGGVLNSNTFGQGDAGDIRVTARDRTVFDRGLASSGVAFTNGQGNAGDIVIQRGIWR